MDLDKKRIPELKPINVVKELEEVTVKEVETRKAFLCRELDTRQRRFDHVIKKFKELSKVRATGHPMTIETERALAYLEKLNRKGWFK